MEKTQVVPEEKIQVIVSNDQDKFMKEVANFCKDKEVISKHYSAQTQFMQVQPVAGIQMSGGVQPVVFLHCIVLYHEASKIKKLVN